MHVCVWVGIMHVNGWVWRKWDGGGGGWLMEGGGGSREERRGGG